jgi:hypothetical protein
MVSLSGFLNFQPYNHMRQKSRRTSLGLGLGTFLNLSVWPDERLCLTQLVKHRNRTSLKTYYVKPRYSLLFLASDLKRSVSSVPTDLCCRLFVVLRVCVTVLPRGQMAFCHRSELMCSVSFPIIRVVFVRRCRSTC